MDVRAIDWLGGDPLLRDDWLILMEYANDAGLVNNIWTSGLPLAALPTAEKVVDATDGGAVSVHLDTLDEGIYRELHGGIAAEKIRTILAGVDAVQSLGKNPAHMFNCITLTRPVAGDDLERTIRFFFEEKGMRTCMTQLCRVGGAVRHEAWIPGMDEVQSACEARDRINYPGSSLSMSTMDVSKAYCGSVICITAGGDVTPCSVIRAGSGNIYDEPLEAIVERHRDRLLFSGMRSPHPGSGRCTGCEHGEVCWGCRAAAYYAYGDMLADDPACWRNRP